MLSGCSNYYSGKVSDHFDGKNFYNPGKPKGEKAFAFLRWQLTSDKKPWPKSVKNIYKAAPPERVEGSKLLVTYVGHVTVLIQTEGLNILTDPIWSDRASPISWLGPKRVHEPGIEWEKLPKIDIVLVSHNHYDHLDLTTIERIWKRDKPRILVPLGNDTIIKNYNDTIKVEAYDWGNTIAVKESISIHLDPMHHWSARGIADENEALWAAFTLTSPNGNIYFVGDAGYGGGDNYRDALKKYGSFRFAILPIGAYEPRWFMRYAHMNPEEAVQAYDDLGKPFTIPVHYDVFRLADEGYGEAGIALEEAKAKQYDDRFKQLKVGEQWDIPLK